MTSEEGSRPATFADLRAAQADLRGGFAAGLNSLRVELKREIALESSRTDARFERLESSLREEFASLRNELSAKLDRNSAIIEAARNAFTPHGRSLTQLEVTVEDHERRLKNPEGRA